MAFVEERLKSIGGQDNQDFGGDVFSYVPLPATINPTVPEDTLAQMTAADYFLTGEQNFNVDDLIIIINSEGRLDVLVLTSTENGVTVGPASGSVTKLEVTATGALAPSASVIEISQAATGPFIVTLDNGTEGQEIIVIKVDGTTNTTTLSASTKLGTWTDFALNTQGDNATLLFTSGGWRPTSSDIT